MDVKGDWNKTKAWLEKLLNISYDPVYDIVGQVGVEALASATPKRTGLAASSWRYEIKHDSRSTTVEWHNDDIEGGYNVALLVQYGHGTGRGVYVKGNDYINPAMDPVFTAAIEKVWKEVCS